jgi:hypothetical protein
MRCCADRVLEIQNWIANKLSRSVIGDVATTFHRNEIGTYFGRITFQIFVKFGAWTIGKNMGMLKKQQMLFMTVLKESSLYSQNLAIRDPANPADAQHDLELA